LDLPGSGYKQVVGLYLHSAELPGCIKTTGISEMFDEILAFQGGLCCSELDS
jgi:hypothetical protein